jgi:hypothetical protein
VGGSITLLWKFGGLTCAQAGVSVVHVTLDGLDVTDNAGRVDLPCTTNLGDGTTIAPVAAGAHSIDLEGLKGGQVAYSLQNVSATVTDGTDTSLSPNLAPVSTSTATADLRWTFAGMSCADAEVSTVRLSVNGGAITEVPCSANAVDGVLVTNLPAGQSSFTIQGVRATTGGSLLVYQTATPVVATFAVGLITQVPVPALATTPGVGGAKLLWQFPVTGPLCANTGSSTTVNYTIHSPSGQATSGSGTCGGAGGILGIEFCNPTSAACPAGSPGLAAGYWTIDASATSNLVTYSVTGARFAVPNGDEATTNIALQ